MSTHIDTTILKLDEIEVAEGFNPRRDFDERALGELADSIRANGITTALTVRRENGHYTLVDGERRLRAAKIAGLNEVPVLVREAENAEVAALVANVQREDLNKIEEAEALARLKQLEGLNTNKALAEQVGKPVEFVSGRLRLLALPDGCHEGIATNEIPVSAEPSLRAIAKAGPEVAEAACRLVLKDGFDPSDLVDRPADVLRELAAPEEEPFVCDVTNGATIAELVAHKAHREALEQRADAHLDDGSGYADHHYLRMKEGDIDRLRASGKLLEFPTDLEWMAEPSFLVDGELGADLAEQLVDRAITEREERAAEAAERVGVEVDGDGPATEQLADAKREERRKDREKAKRDAEKAEAANTALGTALVKRRGAQSRKAHRLNRARFVARRIVADNGELAGAGLRLVMPQLREVETKTLKNGEERTKVDYASREQCNEYLLGAIERAKSVDEVLELIADAFIAAELADEKAIPMSRRISWYPGIENEPAKAFADEIKEVKPKKRRS